MKCSTWASRRLSALASGLRLGRTRAITYRSNASASSRAAPAGNSSSLPLILHLSHDALDGDPDRPREDVTPPEVIIVLPEYDGWRTGLDTVQVTASVIDEAPVAEMIATIDGLPPTLQGALMVGGEVPISMGENIITVRVTDPAGLTGVATRTCQ